MRKIETAMNAAIANRSDWKMDNTKVEYEQGNEVSRVYLYNSLIAEIGENFIRIFDGGYQSNTTKSRLNAILSMNGFGNEKVFQKAGSWFLSVTESFKVDPKIVPFTSGMLVE